MFIKFYHHLIIFVSWKLLKEYLYYAGEENFS